MENILFPCHFLKILAPVVELKNPEISISRPFQMLILLADLRSPTIAFDIFPDIDAIISIVFRYENFQLVRYSRLGLDNKTKYSEAVFVFSLIEFASFQFGGS